MIWDGVFGNETIKHLIISGIGNNKLPHSIMIEGPSGSGKKLIARTIASSMAKTDADIHKIMTVQSPDVIEIGLEEKAKTVGISAVREIKEKASLVPNDLDCKFFILKDAGSLTVQAQNALLKIIEEPPKETYFIFLTESVSLLLPTVRSRTVHLRTEMFDVARLSDYMLKTDPNAKRIYESKREDFESIIEKSEGCIGKAKEFFASPIKENGNDGIVKILSALSNKDRAELLFSINSLPSEREGFEKSLFDLKCAIRDEIAFYNDENAKCVFLKSAVGGITLDKLFSASQIINELERNLIINPNIQGMKYYLFIKLVS